MHLSPVKAPEKRTHQRMTQKDILSNGKMRKRSRLLVHCGYAMAEGGCGIGEDYFLAFPQNLPSIWLMNSGDNLNKRRLTSSIFAYQSMNFTFAKLKINPVKSLDTRKRFRYST